MSLRSELIVGQRGPWRTVKELCLAANELRELSKKNVELRRNWRRPQGQYSWLKAWSEECEPAWFYARHLHLADECRMRFSAHGVSGYDAEVELPNGGFERIEITIAYRDCGHGNAGYQEALQAEMLNQGDFFSATTPLRRNLQTGRVEKAARDSYTLTECILSDWSRGISSVLENKKKPNLLGYGQGSTLLVYGYGLSGDLELRPQLGGIEPVLFEIPKDAFKNGFDRTVVMGWHPGYIRDVTGGKIRHLASA